MATTGYHHGVSTSELPTSIVPARTVDSAVVFAVGTAAVHTCEKPPVNTPLLFYSYDEAVQALGWDADHFQDYTLQELIHSHFALYGAAPLCCVNVFDPKKHASEAEEELTFSTSALDEDTATLAHAGVRSVKMSAAGSATAFAEGEDYLLDPVSGLVTRLAEGAIPAGGTVRVSYLYADGSVEEELTFSTSAPASGVEDTATLAHAGVRSVKVSDTDGDTDFAEGEDYLIDPVSGLVTRLAEGAIPAGGTVRVSYLYADVSRVTADDIIGGIEPATGASTGLELVDEVFPRFRLVPSILLAPRFCENDAVAVVMAAKCDGINGLFKAICLVDIPTDGENAVTRYTDVPGYKEKHNLTDGLMVVCWPRVKLGDAVYGLSTHLAGLMAQTDADHEGIPYASPSNKRLNITSCGYTDASGQWKEVWLDLVKANYLNGQGVYTVSNFDGGMKSWGGRMACYPSTTDPKDAQDSIRRFFNWYQATFILTYFARVDEPLTRRLVQTFLKSEQIRLDGYTAREIILGGGISFDETKNPATDLIDGIMRFHLRITPPPAARSIEATFEFDPDNVNALFG